MNEDKFINTVVNKFREFKGKASMYCFTEKIIPKLIFTIINLCTKKNKDIKIFIVVDSYITYKNILNYTKINNINIENYNIKGLSVKYIKDNYHYINDLVITIGINENLTIIRKLRDENKFMLCILTENIMNNSFITGIRNLLPFIDTNAVANTVINDYIYSPVEEHRYGVNMNNEDKEKYDKCTDYITTSISILGDLLNIEKCKFGDISLGISASAFRTNIAYENGWREDLDVNIPFMKQIDDTYNPNSLLDRACNFYNIVKERRDLITDNDSKLDIIKNICIENKNKKILIISKRGEFAAKITEYLNTQLGNCCGNYHDCIEDSIATDINGNTILIKSGVNKGKPKIIGAQAQSTRNEQLFNDGYINILSIKSASNVKLKIACNIVIFTSPICDNIISVKKRFSSINIESTPNKIYNIYCNDTIENHILNKETNPIITVINETENNIVYDENLGSIIL